jgi:hypothetical protein
MSLLSIAPDIVAGASGELADLGSTLRSANAAAASQITSITAPAADEVSAAITALFGTHAAGFQAASAKAAAFHDDFVNLLKGGVGQYVGAEAASSTSLSGSFGPFSYSFNESATGSNGALTLNIPFHPSLSFSATASSTGAALSATGTFRTPLGTVDWLAANGSAKSTPSGGFSASLSGHSPFGPPISFSASGTPITTGNAVGEVLKASGSYNTPLGPVNIFKASGQASITPDGAFSAALSAHTPGASEGLSVTGTVADGTPEITGGSISFNGLKFSF